jgi:hypothetical protein
MKRTVLLDLIAAAAREHGVTFLFIREGGNHEIWALDGRPIPIPRHREVDEMTTRRILRDLEPRFGKRWWQR